MHWGLRKYRRTRTVCEAWIWNEFSKTRQNGLMRKSQTKLSDLTYIERELECSCVPIKGKQFPWSFGQFKFLWNPFKTFLTRKNDWVSLLILLHIVFIINPSSYCWKQCLKNINPLCLVNYVHLPAISLFIWIDVIEK